MSILKINMKIVILFTLVIAAAHGCAFHPKKTNHHTAPAARQHFPNTLVNKKFQTQSLIGLSTDKCDYWLIDARKAGRWAGNTVTFTDSVHFVSAYVAWCGNDCFTSVFGRYYFVDKLKVRFYTDSITSRGNCRAPTVYTASRPALDLYMIKGAEGRLQLKQEPDRLYHK